MKAQIKRVELASKNWWTAVLNLVVLSIAIVILSACGGGGGGGGTTAGSSPGVTSGEIEAFGSIVVNGVKFEVEGAEVEFEHGVTTIINKDDPARTQEALLHEGMQVEVEVEFNDDGQTGTATRIIIDDELEGEVKTPNRSPNGVVTFTVLGQTVIAIPGITTIDDTQWAQDPSNIADGEFVEVHGLPDGNGNIQATYIEFKAADLAGFNSLGNEGEFEVTGLIDNGTFVLDSYFELNGQGVNYAPSVVLEGIALAPGMMVEVKGTFNASGDVDARSIHIEDGLGDNFVKVEVEGLIRGLPVTPGTSGSFNIGGQAVEYSANTLYFGGTVADLANGEKIEAEGPIVNNVLVAVKIKFKDSFRYEGTATYNASQDTFTINIPTPTQNVFQTMTVVYDASVARNDSSSALNADITTEFEIRARQVLNHYLFATRVKDGNGNSDRQTFEAPVMAINGPEIEILKASGGGGIILFDTSNPNLLDTPLSNSDFEIETNDSNQKVTRATFFATLTEGQTVKARYDLGVEDQIEIELDE
ncbi:MAG: hypothetical protein C0623_04120 [Desulfuromonas sp.]|nr:MAG: hypothetical protein C0623_04120 [Desulfuromonas sp.]